MNFSNKFQTYCTAYVNHFYHFGPLFFNSTLTSKKICNLTLIGAQKGLIVENKFEDQIENLKNSSARNHSEL